MDFDLYKSWHVAWSFGHLKEKDSDTCAFSKAEAWQGSTVKSCVSHFRWYARARFSTALRIMCTCTLVRCTLFTNFHVYWCHLQVSALINYQRYLVIWIVAILDEYFLFLEQWRPSFAKVRDEGACTSFQHVSMFLESASRVYELIWKELYQLKWVIQLKVGIGTSDSTSPLLTQQYLQ